MARDPQPTPAEWRVLKFVAEAGSCAAREVVAACERDYAWSASTVKTLLRRLVEKGQLQTRRVGNSFLYRPSRAVTKALRQAADALLEHATEGTVAPLIAYMVRRSRLSEEELAELRRLLDREEKEP